LLTPLSFLGQFFCSVCTLCNPLSGATSILEAKNISLKDQKSWFSFWYSCPLGLALLPVYKLRWTHCLPLYLSVGLHFAFDRQTGSVEKKERGIRPTWVSIR
jgi:hypothetical protein